MKRLRGSGRYAAGLALSPEAGAFVVIEKRPRKRARERDANELPPSLSKARTVDPVLERVKQLTTSSRSKRTLSYGTNGFDEWEDALVIVHVERVRGRTADKAAHLAARLSSERLSDDCTLALASPTTDSPEQRVLREAGVHALSVDVRGDVDDTTDDAGLFIVSPRRLQSLATLAFEEQRLVILRGLPEGNALLRALERIAQMPESGPARELTLAGALAVWVAHHFATRGPWASRKPPSPTSEEAHSQRFAEFLESMRAARKPQALRKR